MNVPKYHSLMDTARQRLSQAPQANQIVLIYTGIITLAAAVTTTVQFALNSQISQAGGLRNLGTRSMLSSVSQVLPIAQSLLLLVLEFGYLACMVRISRGQYTSTKTLKAGTDRFWPLLRLTLLKGLIYSAVSFGGIYLAVTVFLFSPFSDPLVQALTPLLNDSNLLSGNLPVLDAATQQSIMAALRPAYLVVGAVLLALLLPSYDRYRMANYVLYDHPEAGAIYALRESRMMMRGQRLALFRLDLRFWWFYGLTALVAVVAYGDMILYLLGVALPFSETVGYFLFLFLSLALQFALYYFLRNQVKTAYALVYDSLRPIQKDSGVVLGNIFQM